MQRVQESKISRNKLLRSRFIRQRSTSTAKRNANEFELLDRKEREMDEDEFPHIDGGLLTLLTRLDMTNISIFVSVSLKQFIH